MEINKLYFARGKYTLGIIYEKKATNICHCLINCTAYHFFNKKVSVILFITTLEKISKHLPPFDIATRKKLLYYIYAMPEDKRAIYVWMILYGSKLYVVGIFIVLVGKATGVVTSVVHFLCVFRLEMIIS